MMNPAPDLATYDWIVINSSAGKDSQAMLDYVIDIGDCCGIPRSRFVVVHADLGRMEWEGTKELAEEHARHYGLRFEIIKRPQGDLLTQVRARGRWPSSQARYCTSDHKRTQVRKVLVKLGREIDGPCRILQCLGLRADESPSRARKSPLVFDAAASSGNRHVDVWLPIHDWTVQHVWARIRSAGTRHHNAYDLGMPRLSCVFCIFASKSALTVAARANPDLLQEYIQVEDSIGHLFRQGFSLHEVAGAAESGVVGPVENWVM